MMFYFFKVISFVIDLIALGNSPVKKKTRQSPYRVKSYNFDGCLTVNGQLKRQEPLFLRAGPEKWLKGGLPTLIKDVGRDHVEVLMRRNTSKRERPLKGMPQHLQCLVESTLMCTYPRAHPLGRLLLR